MPGILLAVAPQSAGTSPTPSKPPRKKGKATGGHSLLNGDVRIVPGTELPPNAHGVYQAGVEMKKKDGTWVAKKSNKSINTMFPKMNPRANQ